jgi:branched-chain amino acid transport system permease protein
MTDVRTALIVPRPFSLTKWMSKAVIFLAIAAFPIVYPHPYAINIMTQTAIFAIAAMCLDLLLGYTGLCSFGQAAFFGLGAYTAALIGINYSPLLPLTLLPAVLVAGFAALLGGWLAIRAAGIYFIFLTLALAQVVYVVFFKWRSLTGGDDGLPGVPRPTLGWFNQFVDFSNDRSFYILVLVFALVVYFLLHRLLSSCFGSVLTGIRENEERMRALGYDTRAYKIAAFVISGALTGLAGGLFAQQFQLVTPEQAEWQLSATLMIMVILGGSGSLVGPPIGALVIVLLQNVVSSYTDRWATIMALMFIGVVMFGRGGIWGLFGKLFQSEGKQP